MDLDGIGHILPSNLNGWGLATSSNWTSTSLDGPPSPLTLMEWKYGILLHIILLMGCEGPHPPIEPKWICIGHRPHSCYWKEMGVAYLNMYTCIYIYIYLYICIYVNIYIYIYICMLIYIHIYIYIFICVCVCVFFFYVYIVVYNSSDGIGTSSTYTISMGVY